jgi:hypothetical protein
MWRRCRTCSILSHVVSLLLVLLAVTVNSCCAVYEVSSSHCKRKIIRHTFVDCLDTIPTCSHKPTMYLPRCTPLWAPEMLQNAITCEHRFHLFFLTSIQCAVSPRNDAFVWSMDQRSVDVATQPVVMD